MDRLKVNPTLPLEREFESWIMHAVDEYFRRYFEHYAMFAVPPKEEKKWPADELVKIYNASGTFKVFGLQFKRPHLLGTHVAWNLSEKGQFDYIKNHQDIFYALPTFINRNYRYNALHHCIFWKPSDWMKSGTYFYRNFEMCLGEIASKNHVMGWGELIEQIEDCNFGVKLSASVSDETVSAFLTRLREYSVGEESPLYLMFVKVA